MQSARSIRGVERPYSALSPIDNFDSGRKIAAGVQTCRGEPGSPVPCRGDWLVARLVLGEPGKELTPENPESLETLKVRKRLKEPESPEIFPTHGQKLNRLQIPAFFQALIINTLTNK